MSMIPRDGLFKFYSQDCLRHSFFATCGGPEAVDGEEADDAFDEQRVPAEQVLETLRNMFFLKRMQLCFAKEDFATGPGGGVTRDAFRLVRTCVHACVRARVRACVFACVRACVRARAHT